MTDGIWYCGAVWRYFDLENGDEVVQTLHLVKLAQKSRNTYKQTKKQKHTI